MNRIRCVCSVSFLLFSQALFAAEYVVDQNNPAADDKNPGTAEKPFKSIGKSTTVVQPGDSVLIKAGTYREEVAFTKAGTKEQPITFRGEKAGSVIISGADVLRSWKQDGTTPVYSVAWPHEFVINTLKDGTKVHNHGADAPVGCAEQVLWQNRPLQQVMKKDELSAGTFFADLVAKTLYVWLPGGVDPNSTLVEGCVRPELLGPQLRWNKKTPTPYLHVQNLVCRHASNFAQRGGVRVDTGWRVEDCVVEWNNASGMYVDGDDVELLRVTSQDNGFSGFGGTGKNILLKDCVTRRNNRKGYPVGWDGGGGKFVKCDHVTVENLTACDNTGPGIWFDWDNTNIVIRNCTVYGNHGLTEDWEGLGIFSEANQGPVRIENNIVYSNTGAGIGLAETENAVVGGNTLVDNGSNIEFRFMEGREKHKFENITVSGNKSKDPRIVGLATSLGTWPLTAMSDRKISVDGNVYDTANGKPAFQWGNKKLSTLEDVQKTLSCEKAGKAETVPFDKPLSKSQTRVKQKPNSIALALAKAKTGDVLRIGVNGRTVFNEGSCQVFDLFNTYVKLTVPGASQKEVETAIPPWPLSIPMFMKVTLTKMDAGNIEATLVGLEK